MELYQDRIFTRSDKRMIERLAEYLPERLFDAHAHLYTPALLPTSSGETGSFPNTMTYDYAKFAETQRLFFPGASDIRVLALPMPDRAFADRSNGTRDAYAMWTKQQMEQNPGKVFGEVFVMPGDSAEKIASLVSLHPDFKGLKCYMWFAPSDGEATMNEFLPDEAWQVAQEMGLAITVHLAKWEALGNRDNMAQIMEKTKRYPNAKLILAHCGRSFMPHDGFEGVKVLAERDNIWFDCAAICESPVIWSILHYCDPDKLMWGTDAPISLTKGRAVSFGRSFVWFTGSMLEHDYGASAHPDCVMFETEGLTAMRYAMEMAGLDKAGRDRVFFSNAMSLMEQCRR